MSLSIIDLYFKAHGVFMSITDICIYLCNVCMSVVKLRKRINTKVHHLIIGINNKVVAASINDGCGEQCSGRNVIFINRIDCEQVECLLTDKRLF